MVRGTTAQFIFKLPYPKAELSWATIKFWQNHNPSELLPIVKRLEHCTTPDDQERLCISLTAEETSRFSARYKAQVQLRAQHATSGAVFGSREQQVTVYPMPDDVIEGDPTLPGENEEGWIILDGQPVVDE